MSMHTEHETEHTTKAGARVAVRHADDEQLLVVTCQACGQVDSVDSIDYRPFERRCPDLDTADAAAQHVAAEHARTCQEETR